LLAFAGAAQARPRSAFLLRNLHRTGWRKARHGPHFQFFYPLPTLAEIDDLAAGAGRQFGVDPQLVRAVIQVESNYNTNAVSRKGARGLMQLIPDTARRFGVKNSFDPRQNIAGGVAYLKHLLELFSGNVSLAVAAYNAGENAVLRVGGVPPFPETIDYVRKVTGLYGIGSMCALVCRDSLDTGCPAEDPEGSVYRPSLPEWSMGWSLRLIGLSLRVWHTSISWISGRASFPSLRSFVPSEGRDLQLLQRELSFR